MYLYTYICETITQSKVMFISILPLKFCCAILYFPFLILPQPPVFP